MQSFGEITGPQESICIGESNMISSPGSYMWSDDLKGYMASSSPPPFFGALADFSDLFFLTITFTVGYFVCHAVLERMGRTNKLSSDSEPFSHTIGRFLPGILDNKVQNGTSIFSLGLNEFSTTSVQEVWSALKVRFCTSKKADEAALLPLPEEEAISRICESLNAAVERNDMAASPDGCCVGDARSAQLEDCGFVSSELPPLSVADYLSGRLLKFGRLETARVLVALALIDRLDGEGERISPKDTGQERRLPHVRLLTSWSGHRLLLTAVLVASKMYQDATYDLDYWASVGGVDAEELLRLEVAFLKMLRWNCAVSEKEYIEMAKDTGLPPTLECQE